MTTVERERTGAMIPDFAVRLVVADDCSTNALAVNQHIRQMHDAGARFFRLTADYQYADTLSEEIMMPCSVVIESWKAQPGEARIQ